MEFQTTNIQSNEACKLINKQGNGLVYGLGGKRDDKGKMVLFRTWKIEDRMLTVEFTDEFPFDRLSGSGSVTCTSDGDWLVGVNKGKILVRDPFIRTLYAVYSPSCPKISRIIAVPNYSNNDHCQNVFLSAYLPAGIVDIWRVTQDEKEAHIAHFQLSLRKRQTKTIQKPKTSTQPAAATKKPFNVYSRIEYLFWAPPQKDQYPNVIVVLEHCIGLAVLSITEGSVVFLESPKYPNRGYAFSFSCSRSNPC
jgi:hypothetical protein